MADSRRATAERLVDLHVKHALVFGEIDDLKEKLRKEAEAKGCGFKEEFAGKGLVQVSRGSEEEFKGLMPKLDEVVFLDLPDRQRDKLMADKIVIMERQFTKASRPSVSVKL
jgi:hypothetical protein